MSADRLQLIGWGKVRHNYHDKGPIGDDWLDASEVIAVEATSADTHYRDRSIVHLSSGASITVLGTPHEVVTQLNGGTPQ